LFCHAIWLKYSVTKLCLSSFNLKPGRQRYVRKAQLERNSKGSTEKKKGKDLTLRLNIPCPRTVGRSSFDISG